MTKITVLGVTHHLQWRDHTGDLRKVLADELAKSDVDLIAEEATGLPTTVARRLAYAKDKPWLELDLSIPERKSAEIDKSLKDRRFQPLNPGANDDLRSQYLPREDGIREDEWANRLARLRPYVDRVLCLVGLMHVEPFTQKLELNGWQVEPIDLSTERWFQEQYGYFRIYEEEAKVIERWCEYRRNSPQNDPH